MPRRVARTVRSAPSATAAPRTRRLRVLIVLALVFPPSFVVALDRIGVAPTTDACTVTERQRRPPRQTYERRCVSSPKSPCGTFYIDAVAQPPSWELEVAWPEPSVGSATLVVSEEVAMRVFERDTVSVRSRIGRLSGHHYDPRFGGRR